MSSFPLQKALDVDLAMPDILSAASLCRILAVDHHEESCCFLQCHLLKQNGLLLVSMGASSLTLSPCLPFSPFLCYSFLEALWWRTTARTPRL